MRLLLAAIALLLATLPAAAKGPLADYVAKDDGQFGWRVVRTFKAKDYTGHVLYLSSQEWRKGAEVDRILWRHWLLVIEPKQVESTTALLQLGGGELDYKIPDSVDPYLVQIANESKAVVAQLRQVPVQPLYFMQEDRLAPRVEDEILAYSFRRYLDGGDDEWPALLPMTKSAVRAMDALQAWAREKRIPAKGLDRFVLTGHSKRGWTAYLAAAVDKRVAAIAPHVIDLLAMEQGIAAQPSVWGEYSPALKPYIDQGVLKALGTPRGAQLASIIDPNAYREALTMPKLIVHAPSDEFWLPDSTKYYLAKLPGKNHLRNIPNKGHNLDGWEDERALATFFRSIVSGTELPSVTTSWPTPTEVEVKPTAAPKQVLLWRATNTLRQDFRLPALENGRWESSVVSAGPDGAFRATVPPPPKGFTAYYVEVVFPDPFGKDRDWSATTEVRIVAAP
ncbi:MAG: PhoPQ-activated protein PqaA family protein [Candidatus Sumerlaeia bacterium]|nr:PhoPQ-activated protein PqaA family protein [Candidatus Sumerlaeia bacterium]